MRVLFVCVGNSSRSQMAKAFYNSIAKSTLADSAGTEPSSRVSSKAVEVMSEVGIDISGEVPKLITRAMVGKAERIVTMGCLEESSCPVFLLDKEVEDWSLEDPEGKSIGEFRRIRDEIKARVERLVGEMEG